MGTGMFALVGHDLAVHSMKEDRGSRLLFVLVAATLFLLGGSSSTLSLDTTWASSSIGRSEGEVDVFLGVETDNKRGNVDNLPTDANVPLSNEGSCVVDTLRQTALEHLSLETAFQEIFDLQGQHVIETHAGLIEHTDTDETADKGVTLEKTLGVFVVELEEFTSGTTNFGEDKGDTPDFAFVAEAVLAGKLQLGIETRRFVGTTGDLVSLAVIPRGPGHFS